MIEAVKTRGPEEKKVFKLLHELATSHMALRYFIGIPIEKKIQTEIIKSISDHTKDSKAFARYYDISDELKRKAMRAFKR
jgi:hypothetical protein